MPAPAYRDRPSGLSASELSALNAPFPVAVHAFAPETRGVPVSETQPL